MGREATDSPTPGNSEKQEREASEAAPPAP